MGILSWVRYLIKKSVLVREIGFFYQGWMGQNQGEEVEQEELGFFETGSKWRQVFLQQLAIH